MWALRRLRDSYNQGYPPVPTNLNQQLARHGRRQSYIISIWWNQDRRVEELDATRIRYCSFGSRIKLATEPANYRFTIDQRPRAGADEKSIQPGDCTVAKSIQPKHVDTWSAARLSHRIAQIRIQNWKRPSNSATCWARSHHRSTSSTILVIGGQDSQSRVTSTNNFWTAWFSGWKSLAVLIVIRWYCAWLANAAKIQPVARDQSRWKFAQSISLLPSGQRHSGVEIGRSC